MKPARIEETVWQQIRNQVIQTNPELAKIIDEIDPDKSYKLFRVYYPYGTKIINEGVLNIPNKQGELVSIYHTDISKQLQTQLGYISVPFGIVMTKAIEIYRELPERVFTVGITYAGTGIEMGIWEYFGDAAGYNVSAGARSLFMVPSISDTTFHKRINKEFKIDTPAPHTPVEHWDAFRKVANSPGFQDDWYCEMLFLGHKWYDNLDNNTAAWKNLKLHILKKGWTHSSVGRSRYILDLDWHVMMEALNKMREKVNSYVIDTLRHFISICCSQLPASKPATNDEAAPVKALQQAWLDIYKLKDYVPTIMQPYPYDYRSKEPVYYSLRIPSLLIFAPSSKNVATNMDDMRDLMNLTTYLKQKDFKNVKVGHINFNDILEQTEFTFFHEPRYAYGENIHYSDTLVDGDENLTFLQFKSDNKIFAHNGPFCRGCIRLSRKTEIV